MFSSTNPYISVTAVLFSMLFIVGSIYFVSKIFVAQTKDLLVKFMLLVFTALVGVWIVDKVVAFKISLLKPNVEDALFELIRTLVLMIFSYYFGTRQSKTTEK
jgi:hypothetical protein